MGAPRASVSSAEDAVAVQTAPLVEIAGGMARTPLDAPCTVHGVDSGSDSGCGSMCSLPPGVGGRLSGVGAIG